MLVCCYLAAMRERRAYVDFGYENIYDYAYARFSFGERKARYLVALGSKIDRLPKIRAALASGKLGWCKASRVAAVAAPDNGPMWLESALSLSVKELERRKPEATTPADAPETSPSHDNETDAGPVLPWAEGIDSEQTSRWETERTAENEFAANYVYDEVRNLVLERDGWKCSYPGCGARAQLHVHHIRYRSRGGCDSPWNLTVVCNFHHALIHSGQVDVKGRAPVALEWTPPELMQAVLDRRRNNPSIWVDDLEVREWSLESRGDPTPAVT